MSSQDPMESNVPPERPANPTHFGAAGLYEAKEETPGTDEDASLKVPLGEQLEGETKQALQGEQAPQGSMWEFAKRNHVPALLAVGGIVWLLASLVRRSTQRP